MACVETNPVIVFDDNCQTIKRGQIYKLWMTRGKAVDVLADVTDLEEWEDRLSQSGAADPADPTAAPIREYSGIGSTDVGEVADVEIPLDQVFSFPGNKTIAFRINDLTPANIAAAIAIRAKGTITKRIWFQADDLIYGGDSGIIANVTADIVIPEGRNEPQSIQLNLTFKGSLNAVDTTPFPVL